MHVRTDDEVYRVDAVWLGPPRATFPWRARYVSYGVGLLIMMLIMFVQRRLGVPLDFFSVAWSLVGTVAITRLLGKKISYERPFGQVLAQFWSEVTGPRRRTVTGGGAIRAGHVRIRPSRTGPSGSRRGSRERRPAGRTAAARATSAPRSAQPARTETPAARPLQPAAPGTRATPVRTAADPSAWATRSSRTSSATSTPARRQKKEARRGRA